MIEIRENLLTSGSKAIEEAEPRLRTRQKIWQNFKELMQIAVIFREGVGIDNVETADAENVLLVYKVLPFSF